MDAEIAIPRRSLWQNATARVLARENARSNITEPAGVMCQKPWGGHRFCCMLFGNPIEGCLVPERDSRYFERARW